MNKSQLAHVIVEKCGITKLKADEIIDAIVDIIISTLKNGGEVSLAGFGAFSARARKGRIGVNPRDTAQKIEMPSVVVAKFKAGKRLKDVLKNKR